MAEFLIINKDHEHDDKNKSIRSCWKIGDIVHVVKDGHIWGSEEVKENEFRIVKVPRMSVEEGQKYCLPWLNNDGSMYRRSFWKYDFITQSFINKQSGIIVKG